MKMSSSRFICGVCDHAFTTMAQLIFHNDVIHFGEFKCEECKCTFNSDDRLKQHCKSVHSNAIFKCQLCFLAFSTELYLHDHVVFNHKCRECNSEFVDKSALREHAREHDREHSHVIKYACAECGEALASRSELKWHGHSTKYKCSQCDFAACRQKIVISHMNSTHKNVKTNKSSMKYYTCDDCKFTFMRKTTLLRHIIRAHKTTEISH